MPHHNKQFQKRSNDRYANVSFRVPCDCEVLLLNEEGSTIDLGIGHIFGDPQRTTSNACLGGGRLQHVVTVVWRDDRSLQPRFLKANKEWLMRFKLL